MTFLLYTVSFKTILSKCFSKWRLLIFLGGNHPLHESIMTLPGVKAGPWNIYLVHVATTESSPSVPLQAMLHLDSLWVELDSWLCCTCLSFPLCVVSLFHSFFWVLSFVCKWLKFKVKISTNLLFLLFFFLLFLIFHSLVSMLEEYVF